MKQLILYGAGEAAVGKFDELDKQYDIVCFADLDKKKQGRVIRGKEIFTPDAAFRMWPQAYVYVTVFLEDIKAEIFMKTLPSYNIGADKIINYVPYKYVNTCSFRQSIFVSEESFYLCCNSKGCTKAYFSGWGGNFRFDGNTNSLTTIKKYDAWKKQRWYEIENDITNPCSGCDLIRKKWVKENQKSNKINFGVHEPCNAKCIYCDYHEKNKGHERMEKVRNFSYSKFYDCLRELELLEEHVRVIATAGEITASFNFDDYCNLLERDEITTQISTTAIVFNERIADILKKQGNCMNISIDAGTEDTYLKIKGVNKYHSVLSNIRSYSQAGVVMDLKYIFRPENIDKHDIDSFIDFCSGIETLNKVILSEDYSFKGDGFPGELEAVTYAYNEVLKRNINVLLKAFPIEKANAIKSNKLL